MRTDIEVVPYRIGGMYRVPCIETKISGLSSLWPILGSWHDDVDVIGFKDKHFHVDARFLNQRQWLAMANHVNGEDSVFSTVIIDSEIDPLGSVENRLRKCRRKCRREWPQYPHTRPRWLPKLEQAYRYKKIDSRLVCPHRGTSFQGLKADEAGCVTCPLHGLRFDCATGSLSPLPR